MQYLFFEDEFFLYKEVHHKKQRINYWLEDGDRLLLDHTARHQKGGDDGEHRGGKDHDRDHKRNIFYEAVPAVMRKNYPFVDGVVCKGGNYSCKHA